MNVFDIVGPVMIGPSSSHTAGAARIGEIAGELLGASPVKASILLSGSFAKTYKGHGTDKALIAGIMGFSTDDSRIRISDKIACEKGIDISISTGDIPDSHPNTASIKLESASGKTISLTGSSLGGGIIIIKEVNGMSTRITGETTTLIVLHRDRPGIIASVSVVFADAGINICNFRLSRKEKGAQAVMTIEIDGDYEENLCEHIEKIPDVFSCTVIRPVE